ncbi:putative hydrolase Bmul_3283/BMULJ_05242 [Frankia sp. AiPs1]|uniref:fumarylacetoacetate hydrolase family protein n=1 Tax=Frankia sp. AiPa1 TaxID=573492 RepID=UPI00202B45D7|nr:fumarylacetoacetate hydrolase family protein [Frankia sp. AiPa1]MCL9762598.1 fumarylacetoacetate hydrolase family protein [Frankia sp. AiPa1]
MRFVGVRDGRRVLVGLVLEASSADSSVPVRPGPGTRVDVLTEVDDFYDDLPGWTRTARRALAAQDVVAQSAGDAGPFPARRLGDGELVPPVRAGARILGMGLNYHDHAAETGLAVPKYPPLFARWTASLCFDGTPVPVPPAERGLDWEGELAVVVGAALTDVDEATAADSVFGYAVFNDLSARRAQGSSAQWTLGKNADRSGPMGPVVTADEVGPFAGIGGTDSGGKASGGGDPASGLRLVTTVNGEVVQDGNTADMIFSVGRILSFVSRTLTLNPGDVLITGTPAGVGYTRTPPRYLHPGDTVEVTIDRLGTIRSPVVDSTHRP